MSVDISNLTRPQLSAPIFPQICSSDGFPVSVDGSPTLPAVRPQTSQASLTALSHTLCVHSTRESCCPWLQNMPRIQPLLATSIAARGKNISQLLYLLSPKPLNGSHLTQGKIQSLSDLQGPARSARPTLTPQTSLPLAPSLFPSQPASLLLFRHSRHTPTSGPLHCLSAMPGMLFP